MCKKILILVLCLPLILMIRLVRPFFKVQFCEIRSDRIGHFSIDAIFKIFFPRSSKKQKIFYYFSHHVSNYQWEKMIKRTVKIYKFTRALAWANKKIPGGNSHEKDININYSRDINGLVYRNNKIKIPFTEEENNHCLSELTKLGWKKGDKIICLLIRDNEYLKNYYDEKNISSQYHDYRNSDIKEYFQGIDILVQKKYWVFRMGKLMSQKAKYKSKYFIDYAFCNIKSDLMDIWLCANCDGCISTGTGPDMISYIYQKPILFINFLPLYHYWSFGASITSFKRLFWKNSNMPLTLKEYIDHSYLDYNKYIENGIKIRDLSSTEIQKTIQEFVFFIEKGYHKKSKRNICLQESFKSEIKANKNFNTFHNWFNPNSIISCNWLKKQNKNFLRMN